MIRLAWLCLLMVGCREAGTVTIRPDQSSRMCTAATHLTATFELDGSCEGCNCDGCPVCEVGAVGCTHVTEDGKRVLPIGLVEDGLVFEPPEAGSYSAIFQYLTGNDVTSVVCVVVTVDADGTSSETETPARECCTP